MMKRSVIGFVALALLSTACEEDPLPPPPPVAGQNPGAAVPGAPAQPGAPGADGVPADLPPLPVRDIQERDFLESPTARDPFRDYADLFVVKTNAGSDPQSQREVLISKYALEELKVVGIITGGTPRALISDPGGLGWIVRVGDFIGKPEVVSSGGTSSSDISVNWRVDRIRDNDIVFVREDPSRPDVPATTRVLSMRGQDELKPEIKTGIRGSRPEDQANAAPKPQG